MSISAERISQVLQKLPPAYSAATGSRRLVRVIQRAGQVRRYLTSTKDFTGLQIGAGPHHLHGWLATDLAPAHNGIVYLDARKSLPFDTSTFDYVVAEHVIEHISSDDAMAMLRECQRVLKNNGVLRISTPDLLLTRQLMSPPLTDELDRYVAWSNESFGGDCDGTPAIHVVNRLQREWGHKFLYDSDTLMHALRKAGFSEIIRVAPGESVHVPLKGIDHHADVIGEEFNKLEALIVEATK